MAVTPNISGFTFDQANGVLQFEDVEASGGTNLVAEGIALADAISYAVITAPDGAIWWQGTSTSEDIDFDVSTSNKNTIPFPVDANNLYLEGTYSVFYTVQQISTGDTWTTTQTFEYCPDIPTADVDWEMSCLCTPLVLAQDNSVYNPIGETAWTVSSRTITLRDIKGNSWATASSTDARIDTGGSNAWTGTYSAQLVATITRTVGGVTTTCNIDKTFTRDYQCLSACQIKCIMDKVYNRIQNATNLRDEQYWETIYYQIGARVMHTAQARDCGDGDKLATLVADIKQISGVTDDCDDCSSTQPSLISPLCSGSGGSLTLTQGPGITITGSSPNYTISLTSANQAILAGVVNTVVAAGSGISVSGPVIDSSTTPSTYTYTVSLATGVPTTSPEIWSGTLRIDFDPAGLPSLSIVTDENRYDGTVTFQALPWTLTHVAGSVAGAAQIKITDFLSSPASGDPFTVHFQPLKGTLSGADIIGNSYNKVDGAAPEIYLELNKAWGGTWDWLTLKYIYVGTLDFSLTIHQKA